MPDHSIDTLLMYGYSQPSVAKVTLEIDRDEFNDGKSPAVIYKIVLKPVDYLKWKAVQKAHLIKSNIVRKSTLLALLKAGAPIGLEKTIQDFAVEYLPKQYRVEVKIID